MLPKIIIPKTTNERSHWSGLDDASQSLNIIELATKYDGLVVVLMPDINSINLLFNELQFFAKNLPKNSANAIPGTPTHTIATRL